MNIRFGNKYLFSDVIKYKNKIIRISSIPEISKYLMKSNLIQDIVVTLPYIIHNEFGDSITGEEFIFWNTIFNSKKIIYYLGERKRLENLYNKLNLTVPGDFNKEKTKIIWRRWLEKYFKFIPVNSGKTTVDEFQFYISGNNVCIKFKNKIIYKNSFDEIKPVKYKIFRAQKEYCRDLKIFILGSGNGFFRTTSSFILFWETNSLLIDPPAYLINKLNKYKISVQNIEAIIITHNHEDHHEGLSGLIALLEKQNKKIDLITTEDIYNILLKQYYFIDAKRFEKVFNFYNIKIGKEFDYKNLKIISRNNHHCLKYTTLGLKIKYKKRIIGISGDTKYSQYVNNILKRNELQPEWFEGSEIIFHEATQKSDYSVHTFFEDLIEFKEHLKKNQRLIIYHTNSAPTSFGFELAEEGRYY